MERTQKITVRVADLPDVRAALERAAALEVAARAVVDDDSVTWKDGIPVNPQLLANLRAVLEGEEKR